MRTLRDEYLSWSWRTRLAARAAAIWRQWRNPVSGFRVVLMRRRLAKEAAALREGGGS